MPHTCMEVCKACAASKIFVFHKHNNLPLVPTMLFFSINYLKIVGIDVASITKGPQSNIMINGAVVVAQLVERSLPIPKVHGSNPVIGKKITIH